MGEPFRAAFADRRHARRLVQPGRPQSRRNPDRPTRCRPMLTRFFATSTPTTMARSIRTRCELRMGDRARHPGHVENQARARRGCQKSAHAAARSRRRAIAITEARGDALGDRRRAAGRRALRAAQHPRAGRRRRHGLQPGDHAGEFRQAARRSVRAPRPRALGPAHLAAAGASPGSPCDWPPRSAPKDAMPRIAASAIRFRPAN